MPRPRRRTSLRRPGPPKTAGPPAIFARQGRCRRRPPGRAAIRTHGRSGCQRGRRRQDEAPADTLAEPREAQPAPMTPPRPRAFHPPWSSRPNRRKTTQVRPFAGQSKPGSRKADRKAGSTCEAARLLSPPTAAPWKKAPAAPQPARLGVGSGRLLRPAGQGLPQEGPAMGGLTPDARRRAPGGVTGATSQAEAPRPRPPPRRRSASASPWKTASFRWPSRCSWPGSARTASTARS